MNDIRRTILWVVFAFSLILLWDRWQLHNGRAATFFPSSNVPAVTTATSASQVSDTSPSATAGETGPASATAPEAAPSTIAREKIEVSTDVLKLVFDNQGGAVVHSELLQHTDTQNSAAPVVLLDTSADRVYQAQSGLAGGNFPSTKTIMQFQGDRVMREGVDELTLRFESPAQGGLRLVKTYTLRRGSYVVDVRHDVINESAHPITPVLELQLLRDGNKLAGESTFYSTFTGPAFFSDEKKFQKVEFSDIDKNKAEFVTRAPDGWVAMVQHYFASAWLLGQGVQRENFARRTGDNLYAAGMLTPVGTLEPGNTRTVDARLFIGPQEEKLLEGIAPGLELVKDYGWFTILAKPLYKLLHWLHGLIGNWGWAIVALVVLLKAAFYWLNAKAYASMAKMKAINPRLMALRERYKDKPQQMQQEMMRIYREEKVNPMGGCLPIMIQIPVFIALYWVLLSSVEIRGAPWILWVQDLSAKDPYFILPIVMALTTLFQTALNPLPPDPMQAKLMWIMPLVFSVMFFFFPSGLVLYWITNNVLTIAQQWFINKRMGVPVKFTLPKFDKTE